MHCLSCLFVTVCSAPSVVEFYENNTVGANVTTITTQAGVSLELTSNAENAFGLNGSTLVANKVLDYEVIIPPTSVHLA